MDLLSRAHACVCALDTATLIGVGIAYKHGLYNFGMLAGLFTLSISSVIFSSLIYSSLTHSPSHSQALARSLSLHPSLTISHSLTFANSQTPLRSLTRISLTLSSHYRCLNSLSHSHPLTLSLNSLSSHLPHRIVTHATEYDGLLRLMTVLLTLVQRLKPLKPVETNV